MTRLRRRGCGAARFIVGRAVFLTLTTDHQQTESTVNTIQHAKARLREILDRLAAKRAERDSIAAEISDRERQIDEHHKRLTEERKRFSQEQSEAIHALRPKLRAANTKLESIRLESERVGIEIGMSVTDLLNHP